MPHYKDGTQARLFDRVKGSLHGQNDDGSWDVREREAVVLHICEASTACNASVLTGPHRNLGGVSIVEKDGTSTYAAMIAGSLNSATLADLELVERLKDSPAPAEHVDPAVVDFPT